MNMVSVRINGIEYNLKGEEDVQYLERIASYVDKKLKSILENNKKLSLSSAAVLTALNTVDDIFKFSDALDEEKKKLILADEKVKNLTYEVDTLKKQVKNLQDFNKEIQQRRKTMVKSDEKINPEEAVQSLKEKLRELQEKENGRLDGEKLLVENKELMSQMQSAKYKIIELQNKLLESQIHSGMKNKDMDK